MNAPTPGLLERLLLKLVPHFDIVKADQLYLRRFILLGTRYGNVYLHHICHSDDDPDPHDHPWDFVTFLLRGHYINAQYAGFNEVDEATDWRDKEGAQLCSAPGVYTRAAEHCHQVILPDGPTWSLVLTGPRKRDWNFITKAGPVFWREYLNDWSDRGHD